MPKKIVYKFPVKQEKDRNKAMQIASKVHGVTSVIIGGDEKDTVVVTGEGVNAYKLTKSLKNEFGSSVTLMSMEEVKKPDPPPPNPTPVVCQPTSCYICPSPYCYNTCGQVVCDSNPNGCTIQ